MKRSNPSLRLRLSRIKKSQNQSIFILQFQDVARIARHPALLDELGEITESIERGDGVSEKFYRAGIDRDDDHCAQRFPQPLPPSGQKPKSDKPKMENALSPP